MKSVGPWLFVLAMLTAMPCRAASTTFLPPEQAFAMTARRIDPGHVQLGWEIADGYYMYRERLKVHVAPGSNSSLSAPIAEQKFDPNFGTTMEVYHRQLLAGLATSAKEITVEYQGCAEGGLCYPPQFARVSLATASGEPELTPSEGAPEIQSEQIPALAQRPTTISGQAPVRPGAAAATDPFSSALSGGNLLRTAMIFWVAGLLLSFTPCVLPMVPILSSLIAGQGGPMTRRRGFGLSMSYVLGMSLVYAALGMAAGLAGQGLAAALQNAWVLGSFAALLAVLSLSMFGAYELQVPAAIQQRLIQWSNGMKGGAALPVFVMGGLSALIVGPCVAAPLAGALLYISKTHDVVAGGVALFSLALGMGVPLVLVGISAGTLLPRTGPWMELVKHFFGLMLLGTAIWIASPVIAVQVQMVLWAALALGAALAFGGIHPTTQPRPLRLAGIAALGVAGVLFLGAASGGRSVLQPLGHLAATRGTEAEAVGRTVANGPAFRTVSADRVAAELDSVHKRGQTAMVDFYADWCVACKELESFTFSDPEVRRRLEKNGVALLRVDVTANTAADKALMRRFSLFGPPAVIVTGGGGAELHKVIGYEDAQSFQVSLDRANVPR